MLGPDECVPLVSPLDQSEDDHREIGCGEIVTSAPQARMWSNEAHIPLVGAA